MVLNRKVYVIAGIVVLIGSVLLAGYITNNKAESQENNVENVRVNVSVIRVDPARITASIDFTGQIISGHEINLFSEVVGVLQPTPKPFKPGVKFNRGDTLIHIEMQEEAEALLAQKYQFAALLSQILPDISLDYPGEYKVWNKYLLGFNAEKSLPPLPEIEGDQLRLFLISNNVFTQFHQIKEQEERMEKFTILAPFDGTLTESLINPGALVQTGQQLGTFQRSNDLEVVASVDVDDIHLLNIGDEVIIQIDAGNYDDFRARVIRINERVDAETQTVLTYLKPNRQNLRPGQFTEGIIRGRSFDNAVRLPLKSIVHNNEVFVVRDSIAVLKSVHLLSQEQDSVIVTGLNAGDMIIDEFHAAAFEGTSVKPIN